MAQGPPKILQHPPKQQQERNGQLGCPPHPTLRVIFTLFHGHARCSQQKTGFGSYLPSPGLFKGGTRLRRWRGASACEGERAPIP